MAKPGCGFWLGAAMVVPVVIGGVWLVVPRPYETVTVHGSGHDIYVTESSHNRVDGDRYTMAFHDGDVVRCRIRRFPILMPDVIEQCKAPR